MSSAFTQTISRPLLQTYLKCKYFKSAISQNNKHDLNKVIQQCSRKVATLNIEPKVSLVDERIQTVIKGLKPHEKGEYDTMYVKLKHLDQRFPMASTKN